MYSFTLVSFSLFSLIRYKWMLMPVLGDLSFFVRFMHVGWFLKYEIRNTEGKLHVEHEVEDNSKCPHINFIAVLLIGVYLRRHIGLGTKNCTICLFTFFSKTKISQLTHLSLISYLQINFCWPIFWVVCSVV